MVSRRKVLLAVGYHKTANTWLDRHVFESAQSGFARLPSRPITDLVVGCHPMAFDSARARHEAERQCRVIDPARVPVLAMERLIGNVYAGGFDSKTIANRLRDTFAEARILIVIREQRSMILSTYNQYVRAGGTASLRALLVDPQPSQWIAPTFSFDHFSYLPLIRYYRQLFGASNVQVQLFEQFRADPAHFVSDILHFAGLTPDADWLARLPIHTRVNPPLFWGGVTVLRYINALVGERTQLTPAPLLPLGLNRKTMRRRLRAVARRLPAGLLSRHERERRRRLVDEINDVVGDYYATTNAALADLLEIDLATFGYDMPTTREFSSLAY